MNYVRELRMKYMNQNEWILLDNNFQVSNPHVLNFYEDIHSFTRQLVSLLKLPQRCINTSMVFFHKYFLFKRKFPDIFTKYLSCFTCLFLALKVCDCLMPFDQLIRLFLKLLFKIQNINPVEINDKIIKETKERVFQIEFEILDLIGFDLNIDMPYIYLQKMSFYFKDFIKAEKLIFCTTSFLNDSFKLPLCLYYDPLLILLACIYLCEFYFNVKLIDYQGVKWYQIIDKNVDFETIKEIFNKIKFNYDYSSANRHIKDYEFQNKEFVNKSILDFDLNVYYNAEKNINNIINEISIEQEKLKNKNESNQIKDIINPQNEKNIKEDLSFTIDSKDKNEDKFLGESTLVKVKQNNNECGKESEYKLILDLNEDEKDKQILKIKNKDNRYKKLKTNDENLPNLNEKETKYINKSDKNEVKSSFFDDPTSLQEIIFLNEIKNKVLPEWSNGGISLQNNA